MRSAKVRRMPAVLVVLGFLMLVPSILGFLYFGLGSAAVFLPGNAEREADRRTEMRSKAVESLVQEGMERAEAETFLDGREMVVPPGAGGRLASASESTWHAYKIGLAKRTVRTGVGFVVAFACLGGIIIGWLFIRKKSVMRCGQCGAMIAGW